MSIKENNSKNKSLTDDTQRKKDSENTKKSSEWTKSQSADSTAERLHIGQIKASCSGKGCITENQFSSGKRTVLERKNQHNESRLSKHQSDHSKKQQDESHLSQSLTAVDHHHATKRKRDGKATPRLSQKPSQRASKSYSGVQASVTQKSINESTNVNQSQNKNAFSDSVAHQNNWYCYCPQLPEEPWKNCFAKDINFDELESFSKASIARWVRKAFRLYNWLHDTITRERGVIQRALSEGSITSVDGEMVVKGETLAEFANLYEELHKKLLHCRTVDPA